MFNFKNNIFSWLARSVFIILILSYIFFSLLEEFKEGFVSNYFNLNLLLLAVLLSAILVFFVQNKEETKLEEKRKRPWFLISVSGLITLGLVWFSADELEFFWRELLSLYGGLMTIGILLVLFEE